MVLTSLEKMINKDDELIKKYKLIAFEHLATISTVKESIQEVEAQILFKEFEKNCVKYLPLKGFIIKNLYPTPNMRASCDVDILYESQDKYKVAKIFEDKGYSQQISLDTTQCSYLKAPYINIEMHDSLIPERYTSYEYCKSIWEKAVHSDNPGRNYEYKMNPVDFYIFQTAHSAKHFNNGGTGIRAITDTYVFIKKYNTLPFNESFKNKLKQNGILDFSNNLIGIANMLFANGEANDFYYEMVEYMLTSDSYGTLNNQTANRIFNKGGSKVKYIFSLAFPRLKYMSETYTWLPRVPFLLPVMWIVRLFNAVFIKPVKLRNNIKAMKTTDKETVKKVQDMQKRNGLNVYNTPDKKIKK